jgi:hypothetical protein
VRDLGLARYFFTPRWCSTAHIWDLPAEPVPGESQAWTCCCGFYEYPTQYIRQNFDRSGGPWTANLRVNERCRQMAGPDPST